jgi:hypothetical protein
LPTGAIKDAHFHNAVPVLIHINQVDICLRHYPPAFYSEHSSAADAG